MKKSLMTVVAAILVNSSLMAEDQSIANWVTPGNQTAITDTVLPKGSKIKIEVVDTTATVPVIEVWRDRNPTKIYLPSGDWTPRKGQSIVVEMPAEAKAMIQGKSGPVSDTCIVSVTPKKGGHELRMVRQLDGKSMVVLWVFVTK